MSADGISRPAPTAAPPSRPGPERPAELANASPSTPWTLVVEDEAGHRSHVALARDSFAIGRDPDCDLCLPQHNVSRRHALFEREPGGGWTLRDFGSRYGTFVNGRRAQGTVAISPHDVVQVGDFLLTFAGEGARAEPDRRALDLPPKETVEPLHDRPDRVRVFGSLVAATRELRLDRGPVLVGGGDDCVVRTPELPFGVPRLQFRPLVSRYGDRDSSLEGGRRPPVGPRFEVVDESAVPCLLVNSRPLKSKVLDDDDIIELADHREVDEDYAYRSQRTFALRYLRRGRASWTDLTPPPLREDWTPPSLPVAPAAERVEHHWALPAGGEAAPAGDAAWGEAAPAGEAAAWGEAARPGEAFARVGVDVRPSDAPRERSPYDTLPGDGDDTLPPEPSADTLPGGLPVAHAATPSPERPAALLVPGRAIAPPGAPAPPSDAGLTTGEIRRLLATIAPGAAAAASPARAAPAAPPSPRVPFEVDVGVEPATAGRGASADAARPPATGAGRAAAGEGPAGPRAEASERAPLTPSPSTQPSTASGRRTDWLADVRITDAGGEGAKGGAGPARDAPLGFAGDAASAAGAGDASDAATATDAPGPREGDAPIGATSAPTRPARSSRVLPVALLLAGAAIGVAIAASGRRGTEDARTSAAAPKAASASSSVAALTATATSNAAAPAPERAPEPSARAEAARPVAPAPEPTREPERAAAEASGAKPPRSGAPPKPRPAPPAARPPAVPNDDPADSELQRHLRCQKLGTCNEP